MPATTRQALGAEAVGTFVLVVVGVGALLMTGGDYLATGLAFGLTAVALTSALGWASGGHFNPAVSLGAALVGRLSWGRSGLYALVQTAGALLAGATLWGLMHGFPGFRSEGNLGQNSFGAAGSGYAWWAAFLLETLMTAVLVGVVLAVTDERATYAGLAPVVVGLTLAVLHLASMAATVTSVNPARSVGVGVFAGAAAVRQLWLFVLAPLLGAVVAGLGYPLLRGREAAPGLGRHRAAGSEGAGPAGPALAPPAPPAYPWGTGPGEPQQWGHRPGESYPPPREAPVRESRPPVRPPAGHRPLHPSERGRADRDRPPGRPEPWPPTADGYPTDLPPSPTEPYWSQQLPREWGPDDDEDGRTQIRPPTRD